MSFLHLLAQFFLKHEALGQVILFATILSLLWMLESLVVFVPLKEKAHHAFLNFRLMLTVLPVQLGMSVIMLAVAGWVTRHHWGLLYLLPNPSSIWAKYVAMFLLLDFLDYVCHVCSHSVGTFWRFHRVHHSDLKMDVSTTFREHPLDTVVRMCFLITYVFVCGASAGVLVIRQMAQSLMNILQHTTFRLPGRVGKICGWIFVTPNLHHVHHHYLLPYTNCNYGDVFSIWDRIFGTYKELPAESTVFGVDTHMEREINATFKGVMKMPFLSKPEVS